MYIGGEVVFIHEAVKKARETGGYIVRRGWLDWVRLLPTDEVDGIVLISPRNRGPRPRWQPRAEDLMADDWIVATEELI